MTDIPETAALFLVPTPIGNLEDITLRALRILRSVDVILAEDTRTSSKLLKHYEVATKMQPYHAFNEHRSLPALVVRLQQGERMALISDAGTPAISDPGFLLVRACLEADVAVECLPGATAFVPALVKSGLPSDRFVFEGFLPHKKGRHTRLLHLAEESRTLVLYESPHRLLKTLNQLADYFGERKASVSREITKLHEETRNDTLTALSEYYTTTPAKGEIVIVVEGKN